MRELEQLEVEEISILSKGRRPAVPRALVALAKSADGEPDPTFGERVAQVRKSLGVSEEVAGRMAMSLWPEAYAARRTAEPVRKFHALVDDIHRREGVLRTEALRRARLRDPDLFEAYQRS